MYDSVTEVQAAARDLANTGFQVPSWQAIASGLRPQQETELELGDFAKGWQRNASADGDAAEQENLFLDFDPASRALLLSQSGTYAGRVFTVFPTQTEYRISQAAFRVLLLRRLRLPLPISVRFCRCGQRLDELGDHRAFGTSGWAHVP